jgi:thiol-disulfide isomerase/thioredoxin
MFRSRALPVIAAGLALLALTACSGSEPSTGSGFVAGDGSLVVIDESQRGQAPEITGTTLDGASFSLSALRGKIVILNVWASWCAPCRAEAPILEKVWLAQQGNDVQFVGLDTRDSDTAARSFIKKFGITYPNVIDRDGALQLRFSDTLPPQAIPSTIVIDAQGRVAARALGKVSESTLLGMIEAARTTSASTGG